MKKTTKIFGLIIIIGLGVYLYTFSSQMTAIDDICELYPVGAKIGDMKKIEDDYSIKLMGPYDDKENPETQIAIFCAPLTLCDKKCVVEYQNDKVVRASVSIN